MQIVINEQLKDAIEWTCKYVNEYKVDIDIHIGADGEVLISVCPTYRDTADTPQTERIKTTDYCDLCNHKGCKNCIANNLDDYCVPSNYAPNDDTPQTELPKQIRTPYEGDIKVTPQAESTGSPIGDYRDGVGAWQTDCGWK